MTLGAASLRSSILAAADRIADGRSHPELEPVHLAAAWLEVDPAAAGSLGPELAARVAAGLAELAAAPGPRRMSAAARELVRWLDAIAGWRAADLARALAEVLELPAGVPARSADPDSPSTTAPAATPGSAVGDRWRTGEILAGLVDRVVGQDDVLGAISRRVGLTAAGLDLRPERPNGIFLLAGPTGVGKSAIARALAEVLHGSADALVTVDLSEYSEPHSVNRLFGPPPGYIGSDDPAGWLSTRIAARPRSVLLLDELEKADPAVWNTFLQVFDSGRLTDSGGRQVRFDEVTVVLTSNLGAAEASRARVGFGESSPDAAAGDIVAAIERKVTDTLPPELLARMDAVLVCRPLSPRAIRQILDKELEHTGERLRARGWQLSITPAARDHIARAGHDPARGARHLQRNIESLVLEPLVGQAPGAWRLDLAEAGLSWTAG